MENAQLTLGAHLLLWGFPLAVTLFVALDALRDARQNRSSE